MKKPKILLVHPPGSYVDMPTLGIACLQGYLKAHRDCDVSVWDSNLDYLDYLLSPAQLKKQLRKVEKGDAARRSLELTPRLLLTLPATIDSIGDAMATFRDPVRYYKPSEYNRAVSIVQQALSAYLIEADPIDHVFNQNGFSLQQDRDHLSFSFAQVAAYAAEKESLGLLREFVSSQLPRLREEGPYDAIGFSIPNPQQLLPALVLADLFRKAEISKSIVVGGSFITTARDVLTLSPRFFEFFDYAISFEGEVALAKLIDVLVDGGDLSFVPNLYYRSAGKTIQNPAQKIENLKDLPTPDFSGYQLERYWTPEPVLPAYSTRGCFYDVCSFCNHHENYYGTFRSRTSARVLEDLRIFKEKFGATKIFFVDELMIPSEQVELAEGIHREGLGTKWYAHARVAKQLSKERLAKMARGGCTLLHVGMESANTRVLELMKKGYTHEDVVRFLQDVAEVPISLHLNIIQDYPGERPEEHLESLRTVWDSAQIGDYIHQYGFDFLVAAPIGKEGSPYIGSYWQDLRQNLEGSALFERIGTVAPTPEQSHDIRKLKTQLGRSIHKLNGIFPDECCWAVHLLYVVHYRELGKSDLMDLPLKESEITNPAIEVFGTRGELLGLEIEPAGQVQVLESSDPTQIFVFNREKFSLITMSESWGRLFRKSRKGNPLVREWVSETGQSESQLIQELYLLAKGDFVSLHPPKRKSREKGVVLERR